MTVDTENGWVSLNGTCDDGVDNPTLASLVVYVQDPETPTPTTTPPLTADDATGTTVSDGQGPGFGALAAMFAVAVTLLVARRAGGR